MAGRPPAPASLALLPRVLLLVAVLTGIGAMHVLATGPGSPHGSMSTGPMSVASMTVASMSMGSTTSQLTAMDAHSATTGPAVAVSAAAALGGAGGDDRGMVDDCVLLAASGTVLLAALLAAAAARCRRACPDAPAPGTLLAHRVPARRGPPPRPWPRTALCVIRV